MITESEREQNIARVVESGRVCFLKYGIEKTMQVQIAEYAGLSSKSVKRYFQSRLLLVHAVSKEITANWQAQISANLHKYDTDNAAGLVKLQCFLKVFARVILNDYENMILIQTADYYSRQWTDKKEDYWSQFRKSAYIRKELIECLETGMADGSIKISESPDIVVMTIGNIVAGHMERIANEIYFGNITCALGKRILDKTIDKIEFFL
ncbi:MAG: TetR/AcrR family transcriptional regulator [Lachnospiraceae bacterium]|nr:TetR/AcrR family transcriptional regulator [Lachnospiraceae bacterium]